MVHWMNMYGGPCISYSFSNLVTIMIFEKFEYCYKRERLFS